MPFKIYTYEDPYKLDQTDFWDEIASLPHFCSARTLVNGLKDIYGNEIKGLICTFDDFVKHEDIYKSWTDNISLRVQQYSRLTSIYSGLLGKQIGNVIIDNQYLLALMQNQKHFLEALRLFIELDIPAQSIDRTKGNTEQQLFVDILHSIQNKGIFKFPDTPNLSKTKEVLVALAKKEIVDCRGPEREVKRCERAVELTAKQDLVGIVVHGIHQFTPVQLRLLLDLDKQGVNIIFLYNYQKKYSKIYSSWNDIYSCFGVPIHHDTLIAEYQIPTMQNPSNALACAIGEICENRKPVNKALLSQWRQLYKNIQLREFANITEYAHFVSTHVEDAKHRCYEKEPVQIRGSLTLSNAKVLNAMTEQVYTANKDVHTLLQIYHPEFSQDRHFLAYPIGQFFSAIYRLWDYERQAIRIDIPALKECLSSTILNAAPGEILLRTFYSIEILFENISTYDEFQSEIVDKFLNNYKKINTVAGGNAQLRSLSVYNKYKVPEKDLLALIKAIEEINEIAKYLFDQKNDRHDYIDFGSHFQNLEAFLKQRELSLATSKERELINALQLRLSQIRPNRSEFSGTFRDLREGLYYYLKQKETEEPAVDWIVKNFEQIDGDILQSKRQFEQEQKKTYHFGCVSDRDMNMTVNDQLPWPLTNEFIRVAYAPVDLQFQVYYTALGERSNFLRYALFYGLCFNRCDARISYVKQYGDEVTEPYALLSILGFKEPTVEPIDSLSASIPMSINIGQEKTKDIKYDTFQMMDMYLCPYKFFLDYVTENAPVIQGNFLYQKQFENLLIEAVWKRIEKQPCVTASQHLDKFVNDEGEKLKDYFSFWKATEIHDLKHRAYNYLLHEVINKSRGTTVSAFDSKHMQIRKHFGLAKYIIDISEAEIKNPYTKFESLSVTSWPKKEYSLHKLPPQNPQAAQQTLADTLRAEAKEYVNQTISTDKTAIPSDWCTYCVHRGMCMEPFLVGN